MNTILLIDSCLPHSRTRVLANHLLTHLDGKAENVVLEKMHIAPVDNIALLKRTELIQKGNFSDSMFDLARQFAKADIIVIATPFWDMSFPAMLKTYFEHICIPGITFYYKDGHPVSMCKAKALYFVSTSGGPFIPDFGFNYIKSLANNFYGIPEVKLFYAEMLDVDPSKVDEILDKAKQTITKQFK